MHIKHKLQSTELELKQLDAIVKICDRKHDNEMKICGINMNSKKALKKSSKK